MDKTIAAILGATILVLGGAIFFTAKTTPATSTTAPDDPNRPVARVSESHFDFGRIHVDDEVTRPVTIINDGQTPLRLLGVSTSCDCTFATITLSDGSLSPEFTMHGRNTWQGEVKAGETATINIIYRPAVMPVKGKVSRAISIQTNDPLQPSIEIGFEAEVE